MGLERLSPNSDDMRHGERFVVMTEQHELTLEVRRNGPHTQGYFIGFVDAQPPVTEALFFPGEIFVQNDEVQAGETFKLTSLLPLLSQQAFRAIEITAILSPAPELSENVDL